MASQKAEQGIPPPSEGDATAATLAHEINNPLTSLLNLLYMVEAESSLSEKALNFLNLAREEIRRISDIANGALSDLRGTIGPRETNVVKLLRSVVDFYESQMKVRGITIQARYCPDGDLSVYPGPLRQAFSNLLLNAADAMPQGGTMRARVSLAHEWTGQERHGLRVTFADNGRGIAAEDLPRIFELFFTTKGAAGTGLGLPLVKHTIAKHDGAVRVRSCTRKGRSGTVVTMFLPAHIALVA